MNILIIGATRGIGRRLVEQALKKGHTVTALVRRDPQRLDIKDERLRALKGDILDAILKTKGSGHLRGIYSMPPRSSRLQAARMPYAARLELNP
jgi:nucleoside-diphosphate-sugar epimerase